MILGEPPGAPIQPARRPHGLGVLFAALIAALLGFSVWAWTARVHEDDLTGYRAMDLLLFDVQREFPAFGTSRRPPCGATDEGWVERTWTASNAPSPERLEDFLVSSGWQRASSGPERELTRFEGGRTMTVRITEPGRDLALRLTGTSEANSLACILH
jgi:alpha-1,6-mannosyltransferase